VDLTPGDLLSAGATLAGLVLVFLGGVLNTYAQFDSEQQPAVRKKYRRRAWFCFAGFALTLAGSLFAFLASVCDSAGLFAVAVAALGTALLVLLVMALVEVRSI
jgi:hypothetical protein